MISEALQSEIISWAEDFKPLPVRWLQGKNLHITLVPPWYEEKVEKISSVLESAIHGVAKPFEISFSRVAYGPNPRSPRLIWAEGVTSQQLLALKDHVERVLGIKPEHRPFQLHLTLARFRPEDFSQFPIKHLNEKVSWKDTVQSVALVESHLSSEGADYEVISEVLLMK